MVGPGCIAVVRDPERYAQSAEWVASFGTVWLTFVERTPDGGAWERRVLYEGGLDVDFALNPAQWLEHMAANGLAPEMADVIRRGVRVLADKEGLAAKVLQLPLPQAAPFRQPSSSEFLSAVSDFWYHSLWSRQALTAWRAVVGQGRL
jgi:aminoglycoside 6-adenylyltransferase